MIPFFTGLCKTSLKFILGKTIFQEANKEYRNYGESCPACNASGKLTQYGTYERNLVDYIDGQIFDSRVEVIRFICASCNTTHALLPHLINPYSPYSLRFKLLVLIAYFERKTTVANICESFGVAVSTLYDWKKLFTNHQELFIIIFLKHKKPALEFLKGLLESDRLSDEFHEFFRRYAFPFLKRKTSVTTRSVPP